MGAYVLEEARNSVSVSLGTAPRCTSDDVVGSIHGPEARRTHRHRQDRPTDRPVVSGATALYLPGLSERDAEEQPRRGLVGSDSPQPDETTKNLNR